MELSPVTLKARLQVVVTAPEAIGALRRSWVLLFPNPIVRAAASAPTILAPAPAECSVVLYVQPVPQYVCEML